MSAKDPQPPDAASDPAADATVLADLSVLFQGMAQQQRTDDAQIEKIKDALGKLSDAAFGRVLEDPRIADLLARNAATQADNQDVPPGGYIVQRIGNRVQRFKKPWTTADILARSEMVKLDTGPARTVVYNGVSYHLAANQVELDVPAPIATLYRYPNVAAREADAWKARMFPNQGMHADGTVVSALSGYVGTYIPGHGYAPGPDSPTLEQMRAPEATAS